jgi:hypothetical protein
MPSFQVVEADLVEVPLADHPVVIQVVAVSVVAIPVEEALQAISKMQIINDTEVFEPSECIFCLDADPDNTGYIIASITDKAYWEWEHCLNDGIGDHSFRDGAIPDGFSNACEAMWETELSLEDARQALLAAGFVECPELLDNL